MTTADPDRGSALRRWAPWMIPATALLVFVAPMITTSSGFASDWTNHLWLIWKQSKTMDGGGPSLYVNADGLGVFYPHFVFYGGTLYAGTAALALLIGDTTTAYILSFALAFAAAYGGMTWFAMQCGLDGWRAQMPGLLLVTSAYYLTNPYGRGAWPEFVAISALPLLVASATRLMRGSWAPWPLAAFIAATIAFTGSHNITLLLGSMFLAGAVVVVILAVRRAPSRSQTRRLLALAGVATLCVGVNLWFLLPDVWFAGRTAYLAGDPFFFSLQEWLSDLGIMFSPLRPSFPEVAGSPSEAVYVQLPTLLFIWLVVALVLMAGRASTFQRRVTIGLVVLAFPFAFFAATTEPWHWLPNVLHAIQFGYRLESYVILASAALLTIALCELRRAPSRVARPLTITLVGIMACGSALAVWQIWNPAEYLSDRHEVFAAKRETPRSWYDDGFFRDYRDAPVVSVPRRPELHLDEVAAGSGSLTAEVDPPSGRRPIRTNIGAGRYLVDVDGLETVGRTKDGYMVVRRPADRPTGPLSVRLTRPSSGPVEVGRVIAILSSVALVGVLGWTIVRAVRRRGAPTAQDADGDRYPVARA